LLAARRMDSAQERLDSFKADTDIVCWEYSCGDGTRPPPPPSVAIEDGLTCMNDALASGQRAMAAWAVEDFGAYTDDQMFVFTMDHQVRVFKSHQYGEESPSLHESPSCDGPFRIDEQPICETLAGTTPVVVKALAWDGCP
jgi:hypothetical protein